MNVILLTGNVCAKPEAYTTQNGINRSQFKMAVKRRYRNQDGNYDADFLPVIAWRQTAEYCNKYIDKGARVCVEGTLTTRSYTAQDGSTRWVTEVIADHVESMGRREEKTLVQAQESDFTEVDDAELPWDK